MKTRTVFNVEAIRSRVASLGLRPNLPFRAAFWPSLLLATGSLWADTPVLQFPRVQNQSFSFVFNAQSNVTYSIQYSTTLAPPDWTTALSVSGSNGPVAFTDTNGLGPARFYRVVEGGSGLGIPAADVQSVASGIYDQIQQQPNIDPSELSLLFSVFDIATVESTNDTAFAAAVAAQRPFMLDFQVQILTSKLSQGWYVSWDSFVAQMADLGAVDKTGQALTLAYLSAQLAPLLTNDTYQYSELLPALVLALGQERASRSGGATDPVLGDDLMDPIQFHLMLYACVAASVKPGPGLAPRRSATHICHPLGNPIPTLTGWAGKFGPGLGIGAALGYLGEQIGFPIGASASYQAVVCASILLYSYNVQATAEPNAVWQQSNPPAGPYQSQITATVDFSFQQNVDSLPSQIALWAAGCDFPQNGPQNNMSIEWELTDELPQHGSLVQSDLVTWNGGQARATYQAIQEPVPPVFQAMTSPSAAIGWVSLRVQNVVPQWPALEAIIRLGNPNIAAGWASMTVFYYKWPQLTLDMDSEMFNTGADLDSHILATGVSLQLVNTGTSASPSYAYQGQTQETYANFHCALEGDNPGIEVTGLVGGEFQAAIPAPPDLTLGALQVMVDIGKPQENVVVVSPASSVPATWYWFVDMWALAHIGDLVQDASSPYVGRYAITGWQGSGSTLTRIYSGTASDVTENTKFTLTGAPGK